VAGRLAGQRQRLDQRRGIEVRTPLAYLAVHQDDSVHERPLERLAAQVSAQGELNEDPVVGLAPANDLPVEIGNRREQRTEELT
jgi:hypothetical protein